MAGYYDHRRDDGPVIDQKEGWLAQRIVHFSKNDIWLTEALSTLCTGIET